MSDDKDVLLEEACFRIIEVDDPDQGNYEEQSQSNHNDSNIEIITEDEARPYRFLQNCNSVPLWICVIYNLCMIFIIVILCIYKRWH
ncbi:uncharacterized protein LOC108038162 [Drosophila rhopaloa]|uniref:Uncharacterized protein LOC108038162 n=1 Tax=Drosophila rhopaloa TaxID=1041015 RepID=A0A6P4DXY3_DRORH|nr:uncharacterized protein LOC108038162 [Drosophila rhopaloa]